MARKSLIPAGSFLPAEAVAAPPEPDLLERIVANDAVKHGRRERPEAAGLEEKSYGQSYGNMTSHMTDSTDDSMTDHTESQQDSNTASPMTGSMTGHTAGNTESHTESRPVRKPARQKADRADSKDAAPSPSVRATIQATLQQAGQTGEVLKTVTIKLAPSLDRRVEEHCFQTGRRKQEVVRDALLLYFEAVEEAEAGE